MERERMASEDETEQASAGTEEEEQEEGQEEGQEEEPGFFDDGLHSDAPGPFGTGEPDTA